MDRNLMSLIVANFSLSQPTYTLIINALVGLLSALIGAGVVLYAAQRSHKHEEMMASQETAKEERQKRRNLFGQLFSERKGLTQLYFSRFEATIHSQVHESAQKILKKQNSISDLSACVTGILLAFNLSPKVPLWIAAIGGIFAIVVAKFTHIPRKTKSLLLSFLGSPALTIKTSPQSMPIPKSSFEYSSKYFENFIVKAHFS